MKTSCPAYDTAQTQYPKGSEWRKWDLHVHTPASICNRYRGDWENFICDIENLPSEYAVLGVNDYLFLSGYKKLLEEKAKGRMNNIKALFPVVEFRIKKFAGVEFRNTTRINLHVIFDPSLTPEVIEAQFLNAIQRHYSLAPGCNTHSWNGTITETSLAALGAAIKASVPAAKLPQFGTDIEEGFNNLNVDEDAIIKYLADNTFLRGKYVIAVGKSEWDKITWDDTSIAEKKDIINKADLVFTAAESPEAYHRAKKKLEDQQVNSRLLDCSDAHTFASEAEKDRVGNCFTWLKANPTFEGLLQVIHEFDQRSDIGDIPKKLEIVASNKTKFIASVGFSRKQDATLAEVWFDNIALPLNPDLVAIIGNKGKGKSALSDTIGLLGNTKHDANFTFLSSDNFRQPKDNKAKNFCAELRWESGEVASRGLEEDVDYSKPERVKYIPQSFLETVCTQLWGGEETEFDREIKKVIFSHVPAHEQLGNSTLDDLLNFKTSVAMEKLDILKQELHSLNAEIVKLEEEMRLEHKERIQNLLTMKQEELRAVELSKPTKLEPPENDPVRQQAMLDVARAIEKAKAEHVDVTEQIRTANDEIGNQTRLIAVADKLLERLDNFKRQADKVVSEVNADGVALGLKPDTLLKITIDRSEVNRVRKECAAVRDVKQAQIDPKSESSLTAKQSRISEDIAKYQSQMDEPNRKYQRYVSAHKAWELQVSNVTGSVDTPGSLKYYEQQLQNLTTLPERWSKARTGRMDKAKEIFAEIGNLRDAYSQLYIGVNRFIEREPLARDKLNLNFEVRMIDTGFEARFFEFISQGPSGSFCGIAEGQKMLRGIVAAYDFNTLTGIEAFLNHLTRALEYDLRSSGNQPVHVASQIRKGKSVSVQALYDYIFSLDYVRPRYALRMGGKELYELSPGERGALLLVFYLLVDTSDVPLLIDQPEENLDNQTVYELLVPCMKAAKARRQIIIVTHNPNLAVVCDAEQIIHANLDKKNQNRMRYLSGSIEDPAINKAIVDILEGTMPAFNNRDIKYYG